MLPLASVGIAIKYDTIISNIRGFNGEESF